VERQAWAQAQDRPHRHPGDQGVSGWGGTISDVDKLKDSALFGGGAFDDWPEVTDPLGYMADIARLDGADVDLPNFWPTLCNSRIPTIIRPSVRNWRIA
jgi:hypothetical protein